MNSIKKGKVEGRIYDLIPFENYMIKEDEDTPCGLAVEHNGYMYPARTSSDNRPGVYTADFGYYLKEPEEHQKEDYLVDDNSVISFNDVKNVKDMLEKSEKLKNMEREMLTTVDDLTDPVISPKDRPEMVALKKAISAKNIDIRKYESRFDGKFQNDIRILKKNNISMDKLVNFLDILDLDGYLVITNKAGNEPNPIAEDVKVKLTNSRGDK